MRKTHPLGSRYVTLKKEKALFCWCRQNTGKKSWEKIYHDAEEEELPLSPPYWGTRWGVPEQEEEIRKEGDFPLSPPLVKEALFPPIVPPSMMGVTAPALYTPSLVQKKEKSESHYSEVAECTKKPQEKVVLQMPLKEVQAAPQVGSDRHIHPGSPALDYQLSSVDKEWGLLTATDKKIKNRGNSAAVGSSVGAHCSGSDALQGPPVVGHTSGKRELADQAAKQAATQDNRATKLMVMPVVSSLLTAQMLPVYDKEKKPPGHELSKILACYFVIPCLIALCADVSH